MVQSNKVKVEGKVQGVYFRISAQQKAISLGINGYVQNESDGSVVLGLEGRVEAMKSMVSWCKKGPTLAHVNKMHIEDCQTQNYTTFEIRK